MNLIISTFENFLKPTNSFIRFLIVGIVNTCIGVSIIFLLMNGIGLSYWMSTFTGNTSGAVISYVLNRNFTFKSNTSLGASGIRFVAVILISYFGAYGMSDLLWSGILKDISFILVTNKEASVLFGAFLYTLANYIGQKFWVFKKTR
jgi:putative flippase GtrA